MSYALDLPILQEIVLGSHVFQGQYKKQDCVSELLNYSSSYSYWENMIEMETIEEEYFVGGGNGIPIQQQQQQQRNEYEYEYEYEKDKGEKDSDQIIQFMSIENYSDDLHAKENTLIMKSMFNYPNSK